MAPLRAWLPGDEAQLADSSFVLTSQMRSKGLLKRYACCATTRPWTASDNSGRRGGGPEEIGGSESGLSKAILGRRNLRYFEAVYNDANRGGLSDSRPAPTEVSGELGPRVTGLSAASSWRRQRVHGFPARCLQQIKVTFRDGPARGEIPLAKETRRTLFLGRTLAKFRMLAEPALATVGGNSGHG